MIPNLLFQDVIWALAKWGAATLEKGREIYFSIYLFQWKKTECQQLLLFCHASCDSWHFLKARHFLSMSLAENLVKYFSLE